MPPWWLKENVLYWTLAEETWKSDLSGHLLAWSEWARSESLLESLLSSADETDVSFSICVKYLHDLIDLSPIYLYDFNNYPAWLHIYNAVFTITIDLIALYMWKSTTNNYSTSIIGCLKQNKTWLCCI